MCAMSSPSLSQKIATYFKSVFSLVSSAVNMALPAFAAECRAAAPLLLGAGSRRCSSISSARGALSGKPAAAARAVVRRHTQTDARPLHRPCSAYYAGRVNEYEQEAQLSPKNRAMRRAS